MSPSSPIRSNRPLRPGSTVVALTSFVGLSTSAATASISAVVTWWAVVEGRTAGAFDVAALPFVLFGGATLAAGLLGVGLSVRGEGGKRYSPFVLALTLPSASLAAISATFLTPRTDWAGMFASVALVTWFLGLYSAVRFTHSFPRVLPSDLTVSRSEYLSGFSDLLDDLPFASRVWNVFRGTFGGIFLAEPLPVRLGSALRRWHVRRPAAMWAGVLGASVLVGSVVGPRWPPHPLAMLSTALLTWGGIILIIEGLALSYVIGGEQERLRVRWLLFALWIPFLLLPTIEWSVGLLGSGGPVGSWVSGILIGLAPWAFVLLLVYGVFVKGALDPVLALRKSTVLTGVGVVSFVLFSGIENALSGMVEDRIGLPDFTGALIAGAFVAGVLTPLKNQLDKLAKPDDPGASAGGTEVET